MMFMVAAQCRQNETFCMTVYVFIIISFYSDARRAAQQFQDSRIASEALCFTFCVRAIRDFVRLRFSQHV